MLPSAAQKAVKFVQHTCIKFTYQCRWEQEKSLTRVNPVKIYGRLESTYTYIGVGRVQENAIQIKIFDSAPISWFAICK